MELPGSAYLYTLATVSITFVGFAALLIVLRQTVGGAVGEFEIFSTGSYVQLGLLVTGASLVPPLLALCGLAETAVWRASSGAAVLPLCAFVVTYPLRRKAPAGGAAMPASAWLIEAAQVVAVLDLLLAAAGGRVVPSGAAAYATALVLVLFSSGAGYVVSLRRALLSVSRRAAASSAARA